MPPRPSASPGATLRILIRRRIEVALGVGTTRLGTRLEPIEDVGLGQGGVGQEADAGGEDGGLGDRPGAEHGADRALERRVGAVEVGGLAQLLLAGAHGHGAEDGHLVVGEGELGGAVLGGEAREGLGDAEADGEQILLDVGSGRGRPRSSGELTEMAILSPRSVINPVRSELLHIFRSHLWTMLEDWADEPSRL